MARQASARAEVLARGSRLMVIELLGLLTRPGRMHGYARNGSIVLA